MCIFVYTHIHSIALALLFPIVQVSSLAVPVFFMLDFTFCLLHLSSLFTVFLYNFRFLLILEEGFKFVLYITDFTINIAN